jgi:hypothetical protein
MDSAGSVKPEEVLTVLIGQRPSPISRFKLLFILELVIAATEPFLP